jgi:hypothetical protein
MKLFYLVFTFAAVALLAAALELASQLHGAAPLRPTAAYIPARPQTAPQIVVLLNSSARVNSTWFVYKVYINGTSGYLYLPLDLRRLYGAPATEAPAANPAVETPAAGIGGAAGLPEEIPIAAVAAPAQPPAPAPRTVAAEALGAASGLLLALSAYSALCRGRACKAGRLRALLYASASLLAGSAAAALAAGPPMLALGTPGAIGVYRYLAARRRLEAWLNTILT